MYKNLFKIKSKSKIIILKVIGLTFIEILITLVIIGIVTAVGAYSYKDYRSKVRYNNSMNLLNQKVLAVNNYYLLNNRSCPANYFINVNLNNKFYFGDQIINLQCNVILVLDQIHQIILQQTTNFTQSIFNEGNAYYCIINPLLPKETKINIHKYLPNCS